MSWSYRVIRTAGEYNIHEVFYDSTGTIENWTAEPVSARGDSLKDLKWDLDAMLKALSEPILEEARDGERTILREVGDAQHS